MSKWIFCKCLNVTDEYPNNDYCYMCANESDFEELTEEEAEGINDD